MPVNPSWSPNAPVAYGAIILDPNGNIQQWLSLAGNTGATIPPAFASTLGAFTADGTGGWTCAAITAAPPALTGVVSLPEPLFVDDADGLSPIAILDDMIASFQSMAGRTLFPAQVERLLINLYAYREFLIRTQINEVGKLNLVAFSRFPMLDYLGQLVGVNRLPSQGATATLQFTLAAALSVPLTINAGTLAGTQDGQVAFATNVNLTIPAGATTGTVLATCTTPGAAGNGYAIGQVSVQLNPNSLISAVTNATIPSGGSSPETDDHLRARIQLAPNQFSVAGPTGAYKFFAMSADPSIIDVDVESSAPGTVQVYVLVGPVAQPASSPNTAAIASSGLLAKVQAAINATTVRPLCDTPTAEAVTEVDYSIQGTVTLYSDADPVSASTNINAAAVAFATALAGRARRDIVPSQVIEAIQAVAGVYEVALTNPSYTQLSAGQWGNCTAINLTVVTGTEHS